MIRIEGTRFGDVEVADGAAIRFPAGLVGLPSEKSFVLLEREGGTFLALLQSTTTPQLVLPVVDGASFGSAYPRPDAAVLARRAGLESDEPAVLVVAAVPPTGGCLWANLLAPLIIDTERRVGAQVVLDHRRYSAAETIELEGHTRCASSALARQSIARAAETVGA